MERSEPADQEGVGNELIEVISHWLKYSPGVGAATCQVCGSSFDTGDTVVVYVFRPAGEFSFQVGNIICENETHALPAEYTLGVCELLVEGRLQQASDTESSSLVIGEPEVLAVSGPSTKSARKTRPDADPDQAVTHPDAPRKISEGEARRRVQQSAEPAHPELGGDR